MNYPMNQISDHLIFSPLFSRKAGGSGDFGFGLGDLQRQNRDLDGGQDDDGAMAAMDDGFRQFCLGRFGYITVEQKSGFIGDLAWL